VNTAGISSTHAFAYSAPFDNIAEQYDATFTSSTIGRIQRDSVWSELKKSFHAGDRILDIGCGTGVDACFLAERGIDIVACDNSARMLSVAQRRIAALPWSAGSVQLHLLPAEEISELSYAGPFDGAFSNFGAVNCVADIAKLARDLAPLLKPGSNLLLCLMGPVCLWETVWYFGHGEFAKAFRRFHCAGVPARIGGGSVLHVYHPSVRSVRQALDPEFRLKTIRGIGVAVPPSYLETWANRLPGLVKLEAAADRVLGRCPGIRMLADHVLLRFERTGASET
jgi:ubiquinone/menaquinone biosynthesis C-methylase UbiE